MFDSLVEALEHNLAEERAEGRVEGRAEGYVEGRIRSRALFGEDVAARMHTLLHRLPPEQWPTYQDMSNWSGSGADFLAFLRQQYRDRNAGAELGTLNGSVPPADGKS